MRYRERHRVDWNEELQKTERIRKKGLFISALGFGVAAIFIFGAGRIDGAEGINLLRKVAFALCFVISLFVLRLTFRRGERLRREREEREQELALERIRLMHKAENDRTASSDDVV